MPGFGGERDGDVATDDVEAHLVHDFWNHRIDLAGHDRRSWLHRRQVDLAQPRSRTGAEQAKIIADLRDLHGASLEDTRELNERAGVRGGLHEIGRRDERQSGETRQVQSHLFGVPFRSVDPRTDGGGAHVDLADERLRLAQALHVFEDRMAERGELLAQRHRHRVL